MQSRRFVLDRHEDETGVSSAIAGKPSIGVVAWGVAFPDGVCVTRWCVSEIRQTCVWKSLDDLVAVHGHGGKTEIVWVDEQPGQERCVHIGCPKLGPHEHGEGPYCTEHTPENENSHE